MGANRDYYFAIPAVNLEDSKIKAIETWSDTHLPDHDALIKPKTACASFWNAEEDRCAPVAYLGKDLKMVKVLDQMRVLKHDFDLAGEPAFCVGMERELDLWAAATLAVLYPTPTCRISDKGS